MKNDVLIAFVVFQITFFFLDFFILLKTKYITNGEYRFFLALIKTHMIYTVLNCVWSLQEYGAIYLSHSIMTAVCTGSLLCITSCAFLFFCITIDKFLFIHSKKRFINFMIILPELAVAVSILLSPINGWVFSLDETGKLIHGPLYPHIIILSSLYLLAVFVISCVNLARDNTASYKRASVSLLFSVFIIIVYIIIDAFMPKASALPVAVFATILVIFINIQDFSINTDSLTGLYNRRKASGFLNIQLSKVLNDAPLFLFMCDINNFKMINDYYGHIEGDDALKICAGVLKKIIAGHDGFVSRFGGDEFLISVSDEIDPDNLIQEINEHLSEEVKTFNKPYSIGLSIGYTTCKDPEEPLDDCIRRADEMLYLHKKKSRKITSA